MISYDEVTRYKQSALESSTIESSNRDMGDKAFGQWVADNNDHNQVSLTGKENFYRMDVISASPFHMVKDVPVQRVKERRKASHFVKGDDEAYRTGDINILLSIKGTIYSLLKKIDFFGVSNYN